MSKRFKQGFTLIELLVVIAIIGILSSVVLASLNTARSKGSNAAVKSNLNNMRAGAELYYDDNASSYGTAGAGSVTNLGVWTGGSGVCSASAGNIRLGVAAAAAAGGFIGYCNNAPTAWAAFTQLKVPETNPANSHWCVDSTGVSKGLTAAPTVTATVCP